MASNSEWTWELNKVFENALVTYENDPDQFQKIADLTGKTVEEVKIHYQKLIDDLDAIEAGKVPLPKYEEVETEGSAKNEKTKKA